MTSLRSLHDYNDCDHESWVSSASEVMSWLSFTNCVIAKTSTLSTNTAHDCQWSSTRVKPNTRSLWSCTQVLCLVRDCCTCLWLWIEYFNHWCLVCNKSIEWNLIYKRVCWLQMSKDLPRTRKNKLICTGRVTVTCPPLDSYWCLGDPRIYHNRKQHDLISIVM